MENLRQKEAIEYGQGPLMMIAGPGSGKTYTITRRLQYLIKVLKIPPESILVMTFSRAAAGEMEERFLRMGGSKGVTFGTFHSVFYKVLLKAYGRLARNYIFDDESADKIRFDEMLTLTKELLEQRPDICGRIRDRYQWILIDEFQDIDDAQYDIVKLIAPPIAKPNLTIVGDDDQSIYGFRGSDPGIMLGFALDYPETHKVVLDINYRSTPQIISAASKVIKNNINRFEKDIRTFNDKGMNVSLMCFEDARSEYGHLIEAIRDSMKKGRAYEEIAVLYRNNRQPWELGVMLAQAGIQIQTMTFHHSKGLEFEEVWIIDANEGITPSSRSLDEGGLEDERRAFYVAMTRAKKELYICSCQRVKGKIRDASRFVNEIKK